MVSPCAELRKKLLKRPGPQSLPTTEVMGGADALLSLRENHFRTLLLDTNIEDLNVEELVATIHARYPEVTVVVLDQENEPEQLSFSALDDSVPCDVPKCLDVPVAALWSRPSELAGNRDSPGIKNSLASGNDRDQPKDAADISARPARSAAAPRPRRGHCSACQSFSGGFLPAGRCSAETVYRGADPFIAKALLARARAGVAASDRASIHPVGIERTNSTRGLGDAFPKHLRLQNSNNLLELLGAWLACYSHHASHKH